MINGKNDRWTEGEGSSLLLVARRELVVFSRAPPPQMADERVAAVTDQQNDKTLATAVASGIGEEFCSVAREHDDREIIDTEIVVETEELGRSSPFRVRSSTTVLSGSFSVPSGALVADVRQRNNKGKGGLTSVAVNGNAETWSAKPVVRIVLELVQDATANGETRGKTLASSISMLKKVRTSTSDSRIDGDGSVRVVVARVFLDATFLRRIVGCQRSLLMMAAPPGGVKGLASEHSSGNGEQAPPHFCRLDVAGHAVSARPGRPRLRLQVLECQNLKKADILGKSDPCVLVFWNGTEVGRTPIVREDLNPIFSAPGNIFQLPLLPPMPTRTPSDPTIGKETRANLWSSVDWHAYAPELRLEVWDMDRDTFSRKWKKETLLGAVSLSGPCSIVPVLEALKKDISGACIPAATATATVAGNGTGVMLRLRDDNQDSKRGSTAALPVHDSAGVISIRMAIENATDDTEAWVAQAAASSSSLAALGIKQNQVLDIQENCSSRTTLSGLDLGASAVLPVSVPNADLAFQRHLAVRCFDARGLPAGSDGYCRVFWNGRYVGSTLPASAVAQNINRATRSNTPPASAFERNPVWWTREPSISSSDRHDSQKHCGVNATVPLFENPAGDELTLEVFDGVHLQEAMKSTVDMITGHGRHGTGGDDGRRSKVVACPGTTPRRDTLGRSLGSVTIRGKDLVCPPRGRIDLPLSSSLPGKTATRRTLSISLGRLPNEQQLGSAMFATPRQTGVALQKQQSDDIVSIATTTTVSEAEDQHNLTESNPGPKRWLRLLLEGARLLRGLDVSGTSDPFCAVYVDRVWLKETPVCWGTLAPRWDQWIEIEIFGKGAEMELGWGHEVRVEVWDKDVVGADDFIGEAVFFLYESQHGCVGRDGFGVGATGWVDGREFYVVRVLVALKFGCYIVEAC